MKILRKNFLKKRKKEHFKKEEILEEIKILQQQK